MRVSPMNNPFLALRSFSREDAARFYGRDSDLVLIQSRLYSARTTLLFAGSGVGKTSLINARLTPLLESQWLVLVHRDWASRPPLEALSATIAQASPALGLERLAPLEQLEHLSQAKGFPRQCLLVLDQFEEVFQHWRDSAALDALAHEVSRVAHAGSVEARVLFSMREEFLGELSLFDNLLPDLFNNCYRLKNPTRAEAEEIVQKTAYSEQGVECGPGLETLLDDLVAAPRAGPVAAAEATAPSSRSRIPMPFLQIVCHRLWEQQMGRGHRAAAYPARFVEAHTMGLATEELEAYCREKLDSLTGPERDVAAAAFGFLMTPAGAKMAYPVDVLARQTAVAEADLEPVLAKLCAPDVRILREVPGGRGSKPWVELYHDLYARFLSEWKRQHERAREAERAEQVRTEQERLVAQQVQQAIAASQRRLRVYGRLAGASPLLLIIAAGLLNGYCDYSGHYRPLSAFVADASPTPNADRYLAARTSLTQLDGWPFRSRAREAWARYWHQRAQREMLAGEPDHALLSQLRSLQEHDDDRVRRQLAAWLAVSEPLRTFRAPDPVLSFGFLAASDRVYAMLRDCRVVFWDRPTGRALPTHDLRRDSGRCDWIVSISPDGRLALVMRAVEATSGPAQLGSASELALLELASRRTLWSGGPVRSWGAAVTAGFSPDSRSVVVETAAAVAVISTSDGKETFRDVPGRTPSERDLGAYSYSPFTGSLIATYPDRVVLRPPDGRGRGTEIALAQVLTIPPELEGLHIVRPLARDRFVTFASGRLHFFGGGGPPAGLDLPMNSLDVSEAPASPDGRHLFVHLPSGDWCRIPVDDPRCEVLLSPLGDSQTFHATSADTALVDDPDQTRLREVRLAPAVAPAPGLEDLHSVHALSANGRWLMAEGSDGCVLVDLGTPAGRYPLTSCFPTFSPAGTRLLLTSTAGADIPVLDLATQETVSVPHPDGHAAWWASDDYLVLSAKDQTMRLFHVPSKAVDRFEAGATAFPAPATTGPNCPSQPAPLLVSPDGQVAASPQAEGITIYRKSAGAWRSPITLNNSRQVCDMTFSPDSSLLLAVLSGNVVNVWRTTGAEAVRAFSHQFQPVHNAGFAPTNRTVFAVVTSDSGSEMVIWDLDGSELPVWRIGLPWGARALPQAPRGVTALSGQRTLAWVRPDGSAWTVDVRPVGSAQSPDLFPAGLFGVMPDGTIRVAWSAGSRWRVSSYPLDFTDTPADRLATRTPWSEAYDQFAERLDLKLDEATGLYQMLSPPAPPQDSSLQTSPSSPAPAGRTP